MSIRQGSCVYRESPIIKINTFVVVKIKTHKRRGVILAA
jgi:hypothetical protein